MNTNLSDKYDHDDSWINFKPIYVNSKVIHQSDHFDSNTLSKMHRYRSVIDGNSSTLLMFSSMLLTFKIYNSWLYIDGTAKL